MSVIAAIVVIGLVVGLYSVLHDSSPEAQAGCIEVPAAHSVGGKCKSDIASVQHRLNSSGKG